MRADELINEGVVSRRGNRLQVGSLELQLYSDHIFYVVKGEKDLSIYKDGAFKPPRNNEIYLKDAARHSVPQPFIDLFAKFFATQNIDVVVNGLEALFAKHVKENNMKMNELDNRMPDNFSIDDIKKMEKMTDVNQMKAYAKELISTPSQKPMRPEKIAWLNKTIDSKRKPIDVIKLMYDLMLGGEGKHVIGSRHSMDPNSYRRAFKEEDDKTMSRAGKGVMKYGKDGMKALAKAGRNGASDEKLDKIRNKYDKYDEGTETDHEASMAKGQLYNACKNAIALMEIIKDGDNLEGWVAAKITKAADYLNSVHDYMAYEEVNEDKQKGVDGKACWKGYKRMGTKQKGGKTVDNCVKIKK
jgi:hypothetical protein